MNQVRARLVELESSCAGSFGIVDVRGARIRVPLLLVPDANVGDVLLIDAGVAVAVVVNRLGREERSEGE